MRLEKEIQRRRTLAIISHPDAGKTTLTEKLLLYGGALQLAGSVTARKNQRSTTSDWMELEKQRGISVTSTVLQFEYRNTVVNLLDTPGHKDFSEDTYRVLMAVDSVVMVIDAAKGIESQTLKLFEICRMRGIPIFTFMNKLDRPSLSPLALMDQLEQQLQLPVVAMNWPLGDGKRFQGVYDRMARQAHFYERTAHGAYRAPVSLHSVDAPEVRERLDPDVYATVVNDLEVLEMAGESYDRVAVRSGDLSPVYFGSAIHNFGVQILLDAIVNEAPPPYPRQAGEHRISPDHPLFSGFIFKIQSNMDPHHRDQIAFLRICSGRFTRDMKVTNMRTQETVRLSSSHRVFAKDRETVDEAFAGDVIGLVGHSGFGIGDTLTEDLDVIYDEMPQFAPECFATVHNPSPAQYKRFQAGIQHLLQEGALQAFRNIDPARSIPLLGAVGALQFDVFKHRLENEYGAVIRLESASSSVIRWVSDAPPEWGDTPLPPGAQRMLDRSDRMVLLFDSEWVLKFFEERHPDVTLRKLPSDIKRAVD